VSRFRNRKFDTRSNDSGKRRDRRYRHLQSCGFLPWTGPAVPGLTHIHLRTEIGTFREIQADHD
jgi:hypothetical protein